MTDIILASTSIYRKEQLQRLNISFRAVSPKVDEAPFKALISDHKELSKHLALLKAKAIANENPKAIVIGGDQVAAFNGAVLSKPKTKEKACEQLKSLAGHSHQLMTSLAIVYHGKEYLHTCIANMNMRNLTDKQIENYINIDEPLWSCGSYKLETLGISLFESIECEDYTSIIGIPLMWTAKTLSGLGVSVP